jgi:hypothetical protein
MNRQDARDAKGEPKTPDDFLFANLALLASWRFSPSLFAFFSSLLRGCVRPSLGKSARADMTDVTDMSDGVGSPS